MNQETLFQILNEAGWYLGFPRPTINPGLGWWSVYPLERDVVMSAKDLINLLRLGGWDARPNREEPTRIFIRLT